MFVVFQIVSSTFSGRMTDANPNYHIDMKNKVKNAAALLLRSVGGNGKFDRVELIAAAKLIEGPNAESLLRQLKETAEKKNTKLDGGVEYILSHKFGQNVFIKQWMDPPAFALKELLSGTVINPDEQVRMARLVPVADAKNVLGKEGDRLVNEAREILKNKAEAHEKGTYKQDNHC